MKSPTILSFLIPTNRYETLKCRFYTCLPVFSPIKNYIEFCFNFQSFTPDQINEVVNTLKSQGFTVKYTTNNYNWSPDTFSFVTMRNDAAKLADPNTLYYVDFDDDIYYYEETAQYASKLWLHMLIYLLEHPEMGTLRIDSQYTGPLQVPVTKNCIYPVITTTCRTGLGLIYKNIYGGQILPDEQLKLVGSHEDNLEMFQRVRDGYLCGFLINPILGEHTDNYTVRSRVRYGLDQFETVEGSVFHYILQILPYVMGRYPIPPDEHVWDEFKVPCDITVTSESLQTKLLNLVEKL